MCVRTLSYLAVSGSVGTHGLARQASLSMELDLPNPVIKPTSLVSPALASGFFIDVSAGKP